MNNFKRLSLALLVLLLAACSPAVSDAGGLATALASANPSASVEPSAAAEPTSSTSPTQAESSWWRPAPDASWQIQFTGDSIDTSLDVDVYELDLFDTDASLIAQLHAEGKRVVCYLSAGSWEDWRPDAADFPAETLGNDYAGWPGEHWLDIRSAALRPILLARLDLCAAKGFDGVDPDNLDGFSNNSGFELSADDAIGYAQWLAEQAHARGLGIALKNAPELLPDLVDTYDWAVVESCFAQIWCSDMLPFIEQGKAVFAIEYFEEGMQLDDFCAKADDLGIRAILKHRDLDAWLAACTPPAY